MGFFKKEKTIEIITNELLVNNKDNVKIGKRILKTVKVRLCEWCYMPTKTHLKCSGKHCKTTLCKGCTTFINNNPFCNDCVVNIIRDKSLLIITRP